jgi:Ca2+-binding RTX toxin-like protein
MICYKAQRIVRISYCQENATLSVEVKITETRIRLTSFRIIAHTSLLLLLFTLLTVATAPSAITIAWADTFVGTKEDDEIVGTDEDDVIQGLEGDDALIGFEGDDNIIGGSGDDGIQGYGGDDRISGGSGNDDLVGHEGNDDISGGSGDDRVIGDLGGSGNDDLSGGPGNDLLIGHGGADRFDCGAGFDVVIDYNADEGDIRLSNCEDVGLITIEKVQAGPAQPHDAGDFKAEVIGDSPTVPSSVTLGADPEFRTIGVLPGSYTVHEIGESGGTLILPGAIGEPSVTYEVDYSEECSGTIVAGETKTCTVTNTFVE